MQVLKVEQHGKVYLISFLDSFSTIFTGTCEFTLLHYLLLPQRNLHVIDKLRHAKSYELVKMRTDRFKKSFIPYCLASYKWYFIFYNAIVCLEILCTIYRVMWYLRLLALSVLTCSPNMTFLARIILVNSGSSEKLELGASSSPATCNEKRSARGQSSCRWLPAPRIWPS